MSASCGQYLAFDWDGNVVHMPTLIRAFHKSGDPSQDQEIHNRFFSVFHDKKIAEQAGWGDYELRPASFVRFSDQVADRKKSYFLEDLQSMLELSSKDWQGPQWNKFVEALSHLKTAEKTMIITSRKHAPETLLQGLSYLKSQGWLQYLPRVEDIWTVGSPVFQKKAQDVFGIQVLEGENPAHASENKARLLKAIVDELSKKSKACRQDPIVLSFSDDDPKNIHHVFQSLSQEKDWNYWEFLKVELHQTDQTPFTTFVLPDDLIGKL